MLVLLDLIA